MRGQIKEIKIASSN